MTPDINILPIRQTTVGGGAGLPRPPPHHTCSVAVISLLPSLDRWSRYVDRFTGIVGRKLLGDDGELNRSTDCTSSEPLSRCYCRLHHQATACRRDTGCVTVTSVTRRRFSLQGPRLISPCGDTTDTAAEARNTGNGHTALGWSSLILTFMFISQYSVTCL